MDLIYQKDPAGCGIAAVAMLTGKTYDEVRNHSTDEMINNGLCHFGMFQFLTLFGYAVAVKAQGWGPQRVDWWHEWPPAPWGEAHICQVFPYEGAKKTHWVVMIADGTVYDPSLGIKQLTDYPEVCLVAAVTRL